MLLVSMTLSSLNVALPSVQRDLGVYAGAASAGAAVGLVVGGALTVLSWRATGLLNVSAAVERAAG